MNLGELERLVMDVLWDSNEESHTVREVADHFPDHAYTTIMTVLTRLTKKGFLTETTMGRAHHYRVTASREAYLSSLMNEVLTTAQDRRAVLTSFARMMSDSDIAMLRRILGTKRR
jgi:predicted transcriptional regulator